MEGRPSCNARCWPHALRVHLSNFILTNFANISSSCRVIPNVDCLSDRSLLHLLLS